MLSRLRFGEQRFDIRGIRHRKGRLSLTPAVVPKFVLNRFERVFRHGCVGVPVAEQKLIDKGFDFGALAVRQSAVRVSADN